MVREYIVKISDEVMDGESTDRPPEIVRCRYCKHSMEWSGDKRRCFFWAENGIEVFEDDYCSCGRPKEGR